MTYAKLTRKQMLDMLEALGIGHDALIGHRDRSYTLRQGYAGTYEEGLNILIRLVGKLQQYTRATILHVHIANKALNQHVDVRFAFQAGGPIPFEIGDRVVARENVPGWWSYLRGKHGQVLSRQPGGCEVQLEGERRTYWLDVEWLRREQ
jgi:hypothetical protein